jgi:dual oxidase maturation factor 1
MVLSLLRTPGWPTFYRAFPTAVTIDILIVAFTTAACFLAFAWLVVFPTYRNNKLRTAALHAAYLLGLFFLTVIFITQYSYEWKSANIHTRTQLSAFNGYLVEADIGLHIGLRGFNVTVKGTPIHQFEQHIDYNDQYFWAWLQGRLGFGIHSGRINREFRASQVRGAPYPILWIAEYFTLDAEWIRWGRYSRWGGYYAHVCIWASLPCWFFAVCLWPVVTKPAALMTFWSGFWMTFGCILYTIITNLARPNLIIPFAEGALYPLHGWSFWLALWTGIGAMFLGLGMFMGAVYWKIDDFLRPSIQPLPLDTLSFQLGHLPEAARPGQKSAAPVPDGKPSFAASSGSSAAATPAFAVNIDATHAKRSDSDGSRRDSDAAVEVSQVPSTNKLHIRGGEARSSTSSAVIPPEARFNHDDEESHA